jgi:hypothetical protein
MNLGEIQDRQAELDTRDAPRPGSGPGRIRTCDTRPRKPFAFLCDSEKCLFLRGFCVITSALYHDDRLS